MKMILDPGENLWLGTLILTDTQLSQLRKFENKHIKCNGQISIRLFSSGIGPVTIVKCSGCKKTKNITAYENW